jgi:PAS domain S-box-containing protein
MTRIIDLFSGIDRDKLIVKHEVEEEGDFATQVINASYDGILALDRQLNYTIWNKAMEAMTGLTAEDAIGSNTFDVLPMTRDLGFEKIYERVFNGETLHIEYPSPVPVQGVQGVRRSTFFPIRDEMGVVTGVLAIIRDVTLLVALRCEIEQRTRAEQTLRFLSDAGVLLSSSLDYKETIEHVLKLATEHFDGWCTLRVIHNGKLERTVAHPDPEMVKLVEQIEDQYPKVYNQGELNPGRVMQTRKAIFIPVIDEGFRRANSPDEKHFEMAKKISLTSYICAPLIAGDEVMGTLTLFSKRYNFSREDLQTAEDLARRVALAIKNAILFDQLLHSVGSGNS